MRSWHRSLQVSQGEKWFLPPWKEIFFTTAEFFLVFHSGNSISQMEIQCRVYTMGLNVDTKGVGVWMYAGSVQCRGTQPLWQARSTMSGDQLSYSLLHSAMCLRGARSSIWFNGGSCCISCHVSGISLRLFFSRPHWLLVLDVEKTPCSTSLTRLPYDLFFCSFFLYIALTEESISDSERRGLNTHMSKKCALPVSSPDVSWNV